MAHLQIGLWSKVLAPMPRQSDLAAKQNDFKGLLNTTVSSAANATNESGIEAKIAGGVGVRGGAATRSLRSARGAAHSADGACSVSCGCRSRSFNFQESIG